MKILKRTVQTVVGGMGDLLPKKGIRSATDRVDITSTVRTPIEIQKLLRP